MIVMCILAYVVAVGSPTGDVARDSFLRDGVRPCDLKKLTPNAKAGKTHLAGNGTGFFVSADGYLLTNHHVINDAAEVVVLQNGRAYYADIKSYNQQKDLALLKVNLFPQSTNGVMVMNGIPKVCYLPFADGMSVGQTVYVAGFPETEILGYEPKVTRGMINSITGYKGSKEVFQIDALITHGNSGGPVVNEYGAIVGVVSSGVDKSIGNYNYAINCRAIKDFLPRDVSAEMSSQGRRMDSVKLAKRITDATILVLVYKRGACEMITSTDVDETDVMRRENATRLKKAILDAKIFKLQKDWADLKDVTDWMLKYYGDIEDAQSLNNLARDQLGLHLIISAEVDGRDVDATIHPIKGFKNDRITCGSATALYNADLKQGFPVEAKLKYEDAEWQWSGELKCRYDWTGTKTVRVVLRRVGKK